MGGSPIFWCGEFQFQFGAYIVPSSERASQFLSTVHHSFFDACKPVTIPPHSRSSVLLVHLSCDDLVGDMRLENYRVPNDHRACTIIGHTFVKRRAIQSYAREPSLVAAADGFSRGNTPAPPGLAREAIRSSESLCLAAAAWSRQYMASVMAALGSTSRADLAVPDHWAEPAEEPDESRQTLQCSDLCSERTASESHQHRADQRYSIPADTCAL